MPDLTAKFSAVDKMSDSIANIAQAGMDMVEQFERAGDVASAAFDGVSSAILSVDGVATSIADIAQQTDHWTEAVGNYDKGLLEALNTTEELVEQGFKTADALQEQGQMFEVCERAASELAKSMEATAEIQSDLSAAMDAAQEVTEKLASSEGVSAEAKTALAKASEDAATAMNELTAAQEGAAAAMEAYDNVIASGTTDLDTLESAAERAGHAAEALAEANGKASNATEELSKATEQAAKEAENGGKKGVDALEGVASALAAAGITAKVQEIAGAVYDLANAFSEAESTVVKATGASGAALDGLTKSMMDAYAASKSGSLDDTAGAIGEINTRMALTGEELTDVTGKFLDYANITGTNVVGSVQNVTKIMNKWGVEGSSVESVLDKLAYAGQISGISVDTLSSNLITGAASFQEMGLSLDNAISLLAQLELYGMTGTTAITAMRTAVKNFSDDGLNAETALQSVINEIANMESQADATALAVETFGSRAGVDMANAIRSGAISVDTLTGSLDVASGTLASTAATAQTLDQKWTQASNNIGTAFTSAVQPTLEQLSSGFASVANNFGTFLNKHPVVTKALVALGVGLGSVAIAFAAVSAAVGIYSAVTAISTAVTAAFGVTLSAAIWPITLIVAGIAAVVAIAAKLIDMFSAAEDETAGMTAVTRQQYYELQDLNAEYEEACEKYGETSEEALRLKYQVDDLSAAFEANRQTVEEFTAEVDALCESVGQVSEAFDSSMTEIHAQEVGALALIQKYEDLTSQANLTAAQEKQLEAVNQQLAQSYPELAALVDNTTMSTDDYVAAMKRACEQEAEAARQQQARESYVEALQKQAELEEEIAKATENVRLEQERMDNMSDWDHFWTGGEWDDLNAYKEALEQLQAAEAENNALIAQIEQGWADVAEAEAEAAEAPATYQEAVATAYDGVREKVEELCAAYDEAYQAALESFEGQFGLFDEAQADMEATVANAQAALDSQLAYWDNYLANVEVLKNTSAEDLGITQENYEALMAYAQDGSEQAAGLAASMAQAIQSGDTEAVAALANTVGEVSARRQEVAAMTADWVTDFTAQMDAIEQEMQATVQDMNLSDEAAASATATISSYANQIRAGKTNAVAAAQEVANAVTAALSSANTTVNVRVNSSGTVPGHANGTTNAESAFVAGEEGPELIMRTVDAYANGTTNSAGAFIAGDNGPELIVGQQGSTVFPTEETDRLIAALNDKRQPLQVFAGGDSGSSGRKTAEEQVRRILLEVAGSGAIEVTGGGKADKESVLEILQDNLKPVLMKIIQSEIYEEGELAYDF